MTKYISQTKGYLLLGLLGLILIPLNAQAAVTWQETYTQNNVNNHSGYTTEWRGADALDKPVIVLLGYDPEDDDTALGAVNDYANLLADMNSRGFDLIIFDYLDGDANILNNAENLAHFINYLDSRMHAEGFVDTDHDGHPDYELAVAGASMGGIVARTMFVLENENMGVDTYVTLDSPHHGVYLSGYIGSIAELLLNNMAGMQMIKGTSEFNNLYGWLRNSETSLFLQNVINPMDTLAIALSNGEGRWSVSWFTEIWDTKYHPVTSYMTAVGLTSDFIPYHSAVMMDDYSTNSYFWPRGYSYKNTHTSYFDQKMANPRDQHGGPEYMLLQAMNFIESNWN